MLSPRMAFRDANQMMILGRTVAGAQSEQVRKVLRFPIERVRRPAS